MLFSKNYRMKLFYLSYFFDTKKPARKKNSEDKNTICQLSNTLIKPEANGPKKFPSNTTPKNFAIFFCRKL